ncbi:MAG: UvrD-helicase domain-containing protein [Bacteroidales bacterium]|nr:UvrD-helicase domain-containing protein [Bacteroidales bacterium]
MNTATPKSFVVYKSSAGSGKTYTLVREYIRLVINNPERYSNILAITFTNKAANEMKSRILSNLRGLSVCTEPGIDVDTARLADSLGKSLNLDYSQVAWRANMALTLILHNYSNFAVSTIDSFVHRLVRVFAKDLRLPVNFEVELDADKLITKSIDLLISKVGTDPDLTNALVRFIESKMDDEKSWNIEKELKKFTKNLLQESSFEALKRLRGLSVAEYIDISKRLSVIRYKFEDQLYQIACKAIDLIKSNNIGQDAFYHGSQGISAYLAKLANRNFSAISPNSHVLNTIRDNKWTSSKCSASEAQAIQFIKPELSGLMQTIFQHLENGFEEYILSKLVHQNIYLVAVLSEIEKVMEEFRQNENIVHISEFNKRIAAIVQKEAIPFIYERIGEKYRHYLLDEFQDTSLLQWQNLVPLLENSLSANHFNMIVGDGKQAIYRWRNGEVEQFAVLPKILNRGNDSLSVARENLFVNQYRSENLNVNYRSGAEIINFNNRFFEFTRQQLAEGFQPIYADIKQEHDPNKTGGYIHIEFLSATGLNKEEYEQKMLDRVLDLVQKNLQYYTPESIAILTRTKAQGSMTARHLMQNGISVVSSEVLLLSASPEVLFMISLLQYLLVPDNKIALAEVLTYLVQQQKVKDDGLDAIFQQCKELNQENPAAKPVEQILRENGIFFHRELLYSLPLPEFFEELINAFGLDQNGNDPFIQFFIDLVYDYNSTYNDSASEFLTFWNDSGCAKSIIIPEATPSVRIMTIHKAKGLQFPVVIYPFAIERSQLSTNEAWIETKFKTIPELEMALIGLNKELEKTSFGIIYQHESDKSFLDTLNLLYVTMTRPKERLYILSKDKTNEKGEWKISSSFPDVADLLHEYLEKENLKPDERGVYCAGKENSPPMRSKAEVINLESVHAGYNAGKWRRKILLHREAARIWKTDKQDESREKGLLLHYIMSQLNTRKDLDLVLSSFESNGLLGSSQIAGLRAEIEKVMARPEISSYFDDGNRVFNEKEILLQDGTIMRPDRVVFTPEKVVVMDYKTGKKNPSHLLQLQRYAEALSQMGYRNIEQQIVYLDPGLHE